MAFFGKPDGAEIKRNWQIVRRFGKLYLIPAAFVLILMLGVAVYARGFEDGIAFILSNKESES